MRQYSEMKKILEKNFFKIKEPMIFSSQHTTKKFIIDQLSIKIIEEMTLLNIFYFESNNGTNEDSHLRYKITLINVRELNKARLTLIRLL